MQKFSFWMRPLQMSIGNTIFRKLNNLFNSLRQTDNHLQVAIKTFCVNKTVVLITHRLSNIAGMDKIFVLKDGKVSLKTIFSII